MVIFASSKNKLWLRRFAVGQGGGVVSRPRSRCKPHPQAAETGSRRDAGKICKQSKGVWTHSAADRTYQRTALDHSVWRGGVTR